MAKLRMKETSTDRTEADRERELREAHRKRKRRRREERDRRYYQQSSISKSTTAAKSRFKSCSSSDEARGEKPETKTGNIDNHDDDDDSDTYVPPRPSKDRPYIPYSFDDDDEESRLPPPQSRKRDIGVDDDTFHERLFDAMREDEGPSYRDPFDGPSREAGFGLDYRETLPDRRAFGRQNVLDDRYIDPVTGLVMNRVIFKDAMTEDE